MECVCCAVRNESVYIIQNNLRISRLNNICVNTMGLIKNSFSRQGSSLFSYLGKKKERGSRLIITETELYHFPQEIKEDK